MKYGIWLLVVSVVMAPNWESVGLQVARASTSTSSMTATRTCTENRSTYRGHTDNNCYAYDTSAQQNQQNAQTDTNDTNKKGAQQSSMMGMMAMIAGAGMMAAGAAMMASPPTAAAGAALLAAGIALMLAGMMAMNAAQKMNENANIAGLQDNRMDTLASSTATGTGTGPGTGTNSIGLDPSVVDSASGRSKAIFDEFKQNTGLDPAKFISDINGGKSPFDALAESKKLGGRSASDLKSMADKMAAEGAGNMTAAQMMDQTGLTNEDLAALGAGAGDGTNMSATGEENAYAAGGAARNPASAAGAGANNFDALFGKKEDGVIAGAGGAGGKGLSPEVQAALNRAGLADGTIFQMVHRQYKRKTPMMFGVETRKATPAQADSPFSNLTGSKVEF